MSDALDPVIPPVRSAQLPVLGPDVAELIAMIDSGRSYDSILSKLCDTPSLMTNATSAPQIDSNDTRILFHSLPRPLLRSLLMGTLGPHFYSRNAKRDNYDACLYDDNYAGAYAASLHIPGRRGAFLSQRETRRLIEALKTYAQGVQAFDDDAFAQSSASESQVEALKFTQVIDDELRDMVRWDPDASDPLEHMTRPRFAKTASGQIGVPSTAAENIDALVRMFESRCTVDESDPANPDLDVLQLQSPIMVGNSSYMSRRRLDHCPDGRGSGAATAKVYGLTMSCLKHLGINAESTIVPLFVAWLDDQIDLAEVLGTILGNSRLPGYGYNVKPPGTRGNRTPNDDAGQRGAKMHVFFWKTFLRSNVERSLEEGGEDDELANALDDARREIREVQRSLEEADRVMDEVREAEAEREVYAEIDQLVSQHDEFIALFDSVEADDGHGPASVDGADDD